jgi:hypothetical protein
MNASRSRKRLRARQSAISASRRARHDLVPDPAAGASADASPLLEPAADWVERLRKRGQTHVFYPAARLGRVLRVGRDQTVALAGMLARRGEWTIAYDADGTRYARIHAKVAQ